MPTYDYRCDECGHEFETFQSIKASPLKKCPQCGKRKLQRLIGAGGAVIFRGSGFYCTDYKKSSAPAGSSGSSSSGSSPSSSTSKDTSSSKSDSGKSDSGGSGNGSKSD